MAEAHWEKTNQLSGRFNPAHCIWIAIITKPDDPLGPQSIKWFNFIIGHFINYSHKEPGIFKEAKQLKQSAGRGLRTYRDIYENIGTILHYVQRLPSAQIPSLRRRVLQNEGKAVLKRMQTPELGSEFMITHIPAEGRDKTCKTEKETERLEGHFSDKFNTGKRSPEESWELLYRFAGFVVDTRNSNSHAGERTVEMGVGSSGVVSQFRYESS